MSFNDIKSWQSVVKAGETKATTVSRTGTGDDYTDTWPSAATLQVNGYVTGTVNDSVDVDVFRVSLTAGHASTASRRWARAAATARWPIRG